MTVCDDSWPRRDVLRGIGYIGGMLVIGGGILGGLYMAMQATGRSEDHIKRFLQTLAENQRKDPQYKPHLLIAYDRWDHAPDPEKEIAPLEKQIARGDLDAVMRRLTRETDQNHQRLLRQRYESIELANQVAEECQFFGIKYHLKGTKPSPSANELLIRSLTAEPFTVTHIFYTHAKVDSAAVRQLEKAYSQATNIRPESVKITKTALEDIR